MCLRASPAVTIYIHLVQITQYTVQIENYQYLYDGGGGGNVPKMYVAYLKIVKYSWASCLN